MDNCLKVFLEIICVVKQKAHTVNPAPRASFRYSRQAKIALGTWLTYNRKKKTLYILLRSRFPASANKLQKFLKGVLNFCILRLIFKSQNSLSSVCRFKDQISKELTSSIVYRFQFGLCNDTCYGETVRHLVIRSGEHIGLSHLTYKKVKTERSVRDHLLLRKNTLSLDDFSDLIHKDKFSLEI